MPLFQNSVVQQHLKNLEHTIVQKAFEKYQTNFLAKVENIKTSKEEQYQYGFLEDIFVKVLGYTLNPTENFDLTTELKNQTDSKKADGAILKETKAIAVIELKSTKTKSMDSIVNQAFNYKHNHPTCRYIITSNFHKLRLYIDHSDAYEEFDLFTMTCERFELFYYLLNKANIFSDIPLKLKEDSKLKEQDISNELYKKYADLRKNLFENIIQNNLHIDKLILLTKTQTLLDRMVFIFFAEDRGILPTNTITTINEHYKNDIEGRPLYHFYKIYFKAINEGNPKINITEYNGGLFAEDKLLDSLVIDDHVLDACPLALSTYNFNTDIDVNILGHIFENSLSDIEEMKADIENKEFDKTKTKRKKDGVFYTPEYITKYIVDNTLGKLCHEKKIKLELDNIEISIPKNPKKLNKGERNLKNNLETYREYLLNLKILDPACGSGAFLNQALNFLLAEHAFIDESIKTLMGGDVLGLYDVKKGILENNLYGVDINAEAVEIAKLSLWLRTVEHGRKLNVLSGKIKVGNSLIDDKSVTDDAFVWEEEFSEVFENGGFDCVIGNPPYFNIETLGTKSPIAQAIQDTYPQIWQDKSDIIFYFMALAIRLSKDQVGFIVSNAFMFSNKAQRLRNYILENAPIHKITNFEKYMVFDDASITTAIVEFDKNKKDTIALAYSFKEKKYTEDEVSNFINHDKNYFKVELKRDSVFALVNKQIDSVNQKIDNNHPKLNSIFKIGSGMQTAANKVFLSKEYPKQFPKEFIKKRMSGEIIKKYEIDGLKEYILYFEDVENFENLPLSIQEHLSANREFLENRAQIKRSKTSKWWKYTFSMHKEYYHLNKIWCSYRAKENIFCFDDTKEYIGLTNTTVIFNTNEKLHLKYLLALLNSKILNFRYKSIGKQTGSGVYEYFENGVGKLPIPEISKEEQKPFIIKVDEIIQAKKTIQKYKKHLDGLNAIEKIEIKEEIEKLENKVNEWLDEIDQMMYTLYNLNEEEIAVVENT